MCELCVPVNSVSRGSCIAWVPAPSSRNGSSVDLEVALPQSLSPCPLPDTLEGFCPTSSQLASDPGWESVCGNHAWQKLGPDQASCCTEPAGPPGYLGAVGAWCARLSRTGAVYLCLNISSPGTYDLSFSGGGCSVNKSCLILCDPMDCRMPGFRVLHCLPEFAQTHVH